MSSIHEILKKYAAGELDLEKANEELDTMDAGFSLKPGKGPGWTEQEMEMGFFEVPEDQQKPVYPQTPDMSRVEGLANQTIRVKTRSGLYEVTYDKKGYAVKASRVAEG